MYHKKIVLFFIILFAFIGVKAQTPVIISQPYIFKKYISVNDSLILLHLINSPGIGHLSVNSHGKVFLDTSTNGGKIFFNIKQFTYQDTTVSLANDTTGTGNFFVFDYSTGFGRVDTNRFLPRWLHADFRLHNNGFKFQPDSIILKQSSNVYTAGIFGKEFDFSDSTETMQYKFNGFKAYKKSDSTVNYVNLRFLSDSTYWQGKPITWSNKNIFKNLVYFRDVPNGFVSDSIYVSHSGKLAKMPSYNFSNGLSNTFNNNFVLGGDLTQGTNIGLTSSDYNFTLSDVNIGHSPKTLFDIEPGAPHPDIQMHAWRTDSQEGSTILMNGFGSEGYGLQMQYFNPSGVMSIIIGPDSTRVRDDINGVGLIAYDDYTYNIVNTPNAYTTTRAVDSLIASHSPGTATGINGLNGTTNIGLGGDLDHNTTIHTDGNNFQFDNQNSVEPGNFVNTFKFKDIAFDVIYADTVSHFLSQLELTKTGYGATSTDLTNNNEGLMAVTQNDVYMQYIDGTTSHINIMQADSTGIWIDNEITGKWAYYLHDNSAASVNCPRCIPDWGATTGYTDGEVDSLGHRVDSLYALKTTTLTINGVSHDLSTNQSWTVGTLTNSNFVDSETPSGTINGSNVTFTLANTPTTESVHLYLNGIRTTSFTISGGTITMTTAPSGSDTLLSDYRK